jgi:prepilin-type N-terminal cleavage/methylation domain-containing protein
MGQATLFFISQVLYAQHNVFVFRGTMKNKSGFSLIEILIVIALWAGALTLIGVNTTFLHKIIARNELDLLQATCAQLQQRALATRQEQELEFDEERHSYQYDGTIHRLPPGVQLRVLPEAKGPPSQPTRSLTSAVTFANKTIKFSPDGIIQSGTVYLLDVPGSRLYGLSSWVSPVSFLRKYRYDGNWHLIE